MGKRITSKTVKHNNNGGDTVTYRILLADDNGQTRRELAVALCQRGADVTLARNGRECVNQILTGESFDLVLLDVRMPELDGFSAAALLRANGFTGRIVSMSTKGLASERCDSLLSGCDEHVKKRDLVNGDSQVLFGGAAEPFSSLAAA